MKVGSVRPTTYLSLSLSMVQVPKVLEANIPTLLRKERHGVVTRLSQRQWMDVGDQVALIPSQ